MFSCPIFGIVRILGKHSLVIHWTVCNSLLFFSGECSISSEEVLLHIKITQHKFIDEDPTIKGLFDFNLLNSSIIHFFIEISVRSMGNLKTSFKGLGPLNHVGKQLLKKSLTNNLSTIMKFRTKLALENVLNKISIISQLYVHVLN